MTNRHRCEKCEQFRALCDSAALYGERYGETWSGTVNGERVWYDVSAARLMLRKATEQAKALGVPWDRTQEFSVAELWEAQVRSAYVVAEHLPHVDMSEPVILAVTHRDARGEHLSLIDGTHRAARAHFEKRATIRAHRLSYEFSQTLRIDPHTAVASEVVTEALASGATVEPVEGGFVVRGGTLRPCTPEDHPYRAVLLERLASSRCELVFKET